MNPVILKRSSCDFEKIIQSVDGAWPVSTGVRKMPVHSKLITLQMMGSHASKKSHTQSRPKRWRREHQSTNYRLHFFVWLKRWITNRDFFFLLWVTSHRCLYQKVTDKVRDGFSHSRCLSAEILSVHALHSGSVPFHTRTEMLWLGPADRALHPSTYPSQKQSGILFLSAPWTRSCFRLPQSSL